METKANKKAKTKIEKSISEVKTENAANIISTLVQRDQHFIYKMQTQTEKLPAKKAKQYRQKMRRLLENFYFKICLQKNTEIKNQTISEFLIFYKTHYILQDFTVTSITDSRDESKRESYTQLLKTVQNSLTK